MTKHPQQTILVAGVHRSGSTWVYNAVRHLLIEQGTPFHTAWIADYNRADPAPIHLVKAHHLKEVSFEPDFILTTLRRRIESIASLIRIGWVKDTAVDIVKADRRLERLYNDWNARTNLETAYRDILENPVPAVARIANCLGLDMSQDTFERIATDLSNQEEPSSNEYDKVTLIHPNHRNPSSYQDEDLARIRKVLHENGRPQS